jgi:hypothetical protein
MSYGIRFKLILNLKTARVTDQVIDERHFCCGAFKTVWHIASSGGAPNNVSC